MMADPTPFPLLPGMTRPSKPSRYLNGTGEMKVVLRSLSDVDGRTLNAKRAKALKAAVVSDLTGGGTESDLSAIQLALVEELAITSAVIEDLQSRLLSSEAGDAKALVPLLNQRRRTASLLGLQRVARDVGTIESYLATTGV